MSDRDTRLNERAATNNPDAAGVALAAKVRDWPWAEIPCESCEFGRGVKEALYDTEVLPPGTELPSPSDPPRLFTKEDCVVCDGTGVEAADDNYRLRWLAYYGDVGAHRLTEHFSWPLPPESQCCKHGTVCDGSCGYTRRPVPAAVVFCGLPEHLQLVGAYGAAWLALLAWKDCPVPAQSVEKVDPLMRAESEVMLGMLVLHKLRTYIRRPTSENKKAWLLAALSMPTWVPGAGRLPTIGPPIFDHLASVRSAIEVSGKTEEEVYRVAQAKVEEWCFKGQEVT